MESVVTQADLLSVNEEKLFMTTSLGCRVSVWSSKGRFWVEYWFNIYSVFVALHVYVFQCLYPSLNTTDRANENVTHQAQTPPLVKQRGWKLNFTTIILLYSPYDTAALFKTQRAQKDASKIWPPKRLWFLLSSSGEFVLSPSSSHVNLLRARLHSWLFFF